MVHLNIMDTEGICRAKRSCILPLWTERGREKKGLVQKLLGGKRLRVHGKSARDQEFGVQGLECRVQGVLEYGRCWGREPRKPNTP